MITDTHTHLYVEQFDADREAMILRAKSVGVSRFLFLPSTARITRECLT